MEVSQVKGQCGQILRYLEEHGSITSLQGIEELHIMRVASRIHDLKDLGFNISREFIRYENEHGERKHYAVYRLEN